MILKILLSIFIIFDLVSIVFIMFCLCVDIDPEDIIFHSKSFESAYISFDQFLKLQQIKPEKWATTKSDGCVYYYSSEKFEPVYMKTRLDVLKLAFYKRSLLKHKISDNQLKASKRLIGEWKKDVDSMFYSHESERK